MIENLQIILRSIQVGDIGKCMLLSGAEGWNQTEKDWKRLVDNPLNTCLAIESSHRIIGTATAMNYSDEIAWIGMVLVDKAYRGRGISKILLSDLLHRLKTCHSVKLDATPAGLPVYEKYGFKNEYIIHRMTALSLNNFQAFNNGITPEPILSSDIPEVSALDCSIFGAERSYLLKCLIKDNQDMAWCIKSAGRITAFALGRNGRKYQHIGPVSASTTENAIALISCILQKYVRQPVVLDILADKKELIHWLSLVGFIRQRDFVRMYLHTNLCAGKTENQFIICGPEFG